MGFGLSELASSGGQGSVELNPEVDRLINETRQWHGAEKPIAFLGEVGAGKTVVAALLKHTISTRWVPSRKGRWDALMVSGHDEINETIRTMKRGLFPSPTVKDDYPALVIEMHRMQGAASKIGLKLRDISGESYFGYLSGSPPDNIDDLLIDLLQGGGSYIAHAKAYVLMISCEDADEWETDKPHAVNAIETIHAIQNRMNRLDHNDRFTTPVALVFTKGDTLPAEHAGKSPRSLAHMYHDLDSTLRIRHSGPLACFKVHVKTDGAHFEQDGDGLNDGDRLLQSGPGAHDPEDTEPGGDGDSDPPPSLRLAVPLDYSYNMYYKLITWLVDPR